MMERRFCRMTDCWPLKRSSRVASVATTACPVFTTCSMTVREPRKRLVFSGSDSPRDISTDMLPVIGSTSTIKPRDARMRVITRSMTLRRTSSSSRDELRSRASSYSRWSRMPKSTSRVKGTSSLTNGEAETGCTRTAGKLDLQMPTEEALTPDVEALLERLNPPQQEAVTHGEGPLLIFAGAGSGKTRVLTARIAYLIATHRVCPDRLLAVASTNKAAKYMRSRFAAAVRQWADNLRVV